MGNYFIDSLLKYDFGHPLKQLCVLKVFHLFKNHKIKECIVSTENAMLNPLPMIAEHHHHNGGNDQDGNSEAIRIVNSIQDITYRRITDYQCLPFAVYQSKLWPYLANESALRIYSRAFQPPSAKAPNESHNL